MNVTAWPCPQAQGGTRDEYALAFDKGRPHRLLILPALFEEANKLRRHTVEVMRRLDGAEIDTFLPDLPGCNESLQPLENQTLASWRDAAQAAAAHFGATHLLTVRTSAILAPPELSGWRYAPKPGANALRALMRARLVAMREAGREEGIEEMLEAGRSEGLDLAGYRIGPRMFADLEQSRLHDSGRLADIDQETIGGSGLWLRAEPGEAPAQVDALAAIVSMGIGA
ncbi:MAG: hypothetical protein PHE36_12685 [Novosphingobium sp.]|nr:hypothetical protein [Novosphingobium sp.]